MSDADWRASRVKRVEVAAIAAVGYPVIAALGRTLRWREDGVEHLDAVAASGRQPILAFWHGRILPATVYFRDRGVVVITSQNFDGEWIARIMRRFGYLQARGSTSRGAKRALLQLRRDMAEGRPAAFTVDGPRGPGLPGAAGRGLAGEGDRQPGRAVPHRGGPVLDGWAAGTGRRCRSRGAAWRSRSASPLDVPGDADEDGDRAEARRARAAPARPAVARARSCCAEP